MKEVLDLIREFGLSLVVAVAASYALYKFFFFSIREVKATFEKRHETMAKNMEEVKVSLAEVKSDLKVLVEFLKSYKKQIMGKISGPCKAAAKRKFKVWPSAYASGWGVRCTKAGGPSKMGKGNRNRKK